MMLFSSSRRGCRSVPQGHVLFRLVFSFFVVSTGLVFGTGFLTARQPQAQVRSSGKTPLAPHFPKLFPCAQGQVVYADGQPARNTMIRFALLFGDDATALRYLGARTDANGNFVGPEIPEGVRRARYAVSVSPALLAPENSRDAYAAPQLISVTRGHPAQMHFVLQPPAYLQGRVCTRLGRPVSKIWVQVPDVTFTTGPTTYHSLTRAMTDSNGNFVLPVPAGRVTVELERTVATVYHAPRFVVDMEPGQVAQITFPISPRQRPDVNPIEPVPVTRYTALR